MSRIWIGVIIAVVVVIFVVFEGYLYELPSAAVALEGELSPVKAKAIELLVDSTNLLITFSYGIFGVLAYFLKDDFQGSRDQGTFELVLLATVSFLAIGSIFCGHLLISSLIEMLSNDFVDLRTSVVVSTSRWQFYLLSISILVLVAYANERRC